MFLIVVAAFSIVSNGIMLVLERGARWQSSSRWEPPTVQVQRIFVLLGLYMGGCWGRRSGCSPGAGVLGLDHFGLPLDTDVYYITKLPVNVNWGALWCCSHRCSCRFTATLYPARLAAQLRPVDGLRDAP